MFEVTPDQVSGRQGRHQAELPSQDGAADHPGQLGGVLSWRGKRVRGPEIGEDLPGLTG